MRVQIKDAEQALQTSRETVHSAVEEFGAKVLDSMVVLSMQGRWWLYIYGNTTEM